MDRRGFLRRFGVGAAAAVAAPSIIKAALPEPAPELATKRFDLPDGRTFHIAHMPPQDSNRYQYPMTYDECYISQWDKLAEREFFRPHWPKLVERYGNVSIVDMLKLTS